MGETEVEMRARHAREMQGLCEKRRRQLAAEIRVLTDQQERELTEARLDREGPLKADESGPWVLGKAGWEFLAAEQRPKTSVLAGRLHVELEYLDARALEQAATGFKQSVEVTRLELEVLRPGRVRLK